MFQADKDKANFGKLVESIKKSKKVELLYNTVHNSKVLI